MTEFHKVVIPDRHIVSAKIGFTKMPGELQWELDPDLYRWLDENTEFAYGISSGAEGMNIFDNLQDYEGECLTVEVFYMRYQPYIWFYSGEDAILFKLVWS